MELIESAGNFYLNAEQHNSGSSEVEALINISDRDDILSRQDNWAVHITRFAVDTQASLFYVPPDATATVTLTCFNYTDVERHRLDTTKNFVDRRIVTMAKGASTLSDFLEQLNAGVPMCERIDRHHSIIAGGDPNDYRSGRWSITASGAFRFQAMAILPTTGTIGAEPHFDPTGYEYFVNIQVSESMRIILGFENATLNILGNESSLATYKKQIANFQSILPAYRNDIKNWRWLGTNMQHKLCPWYDEMWYIINNVILQGIPISGVPGNDHGEVHPEDDFHLATGVYKRDGGYINGIRFWEVEDWLITNYRSPQAGPPNEIPDSSHEMTKFTFVEALGRTGRINAHYDTLEQESWYGGAGIALSNEPDMTWDEEIDYNTAGFANAGAYITATTGRWAYQMNAKQIWGSWNRAYILGVVNPRQLHLNQTNLTNAGGIIVDDGHTSKGPPPTVGDTIYIPDAYNYDGHGHYPGNDPVGYTRFQRGIITAVEASTFVRTTQPQPNPAADATWLVTFIGDPCRPDR